MKAPELPGNLTCPECGRKQPAEIPAIKCQAFYKCENCKRIIKAKESCCVFCDYGDKKCPAAEAHKLFKQRIC